MPNRRKIRGALAAGALVAGAVLVSAQEPQNDGSERPEVDVASTGMGPMCWAAIVETAYQVSTRCDLGDKAASQETLDAYERARNSLRDKFLASGWSEESLQAFLGRQGQAAVPTEVLCDFDRDRDTGEFLIALAQAKPEDIDETTKHILVIPGPPKWGTCL